MDNKQFNQYFKRQIELWTEETQLSLQNKHILLVGSGGLGCSVGIALGAIGIGHIDIVDFDKVSVHNIHRQIAFNIEDENRYKCDVLKTTIESKSPFTCVNAYKVDFKEFESSIKYDLIIDATDNLEIRTVINQYAKSKKTPWIYGSVEEFHGQVCFFEQSSFEAVFNISNHTPKGIAAPIVMNIASLQANLAIRYLVNLPIKKDYLYYIFFDSDGIFQTQKFQLPIS